MRDPVEACPDRKPDRAGVLLLPCLVYTLIAVVWHGHHFNTITGDEPHYLLTADSIVRDGDLRVVNNHTIDTPVMQQMPPGFTFADTHAVNGYSIHGIGLPLLLVPAYAARGVIGAKLFMAAFAGCIPFLVHRLAQVVVADTFWALATALIVALAPPFLVASNQIFPDLPAGIAVFYCLVELLAIHRADVPTWSRPRLFLIAITIAYLPWLHIKLVAPALVLYAAVMVESARRIALPASRDEARLLMVVSSAALCVSLGVLGAYNQRAFGTVLGPYDGNAVSTDLRQVAVVFGGLHLDRLQGMFIQAPVLVLGLFGIAAFVADVPFFALVVALLYVSILGANAAHPNWYGGFSFAGRFAWPVALLWCFPLVYAIRLLRLRNKAVWVFAAFTVALTAQVIFACVALTQDDYLYNDHILSGADDWLRRNPYADVLGLSPRQVARFLPSFRDVAAWPRSPANWVWTGALAFVSWFGYRFQRGRRTFTLASPGLALCAAAVLAAAPGNVLPLSLDARYRPHLVGHAERTGWVADPRESGYVVLGPNIGLWRGKYEITLRYETSNHHEGKLRWDCVMGPHGSRGSIVLPIPSGRAVDGTLVRSCAVSRKDIAGRFSFRVFSEGDVDVRVRSASIVPG